jgi:hypothetical protein
MRNNIVIVSHRLEIVLVAKYSTNHCPLHRANMISVIVMPPSTCGIAVQYRDPSLLGSFSVTRAKARHSNPVCPSCWNKLMTVWVEHVNIAVYILHHPSRMNEWCGPWFLLIIKFVPQMHVCRVSDTVRN